MHDARRALPFPSLRNGRDLGGYPTSDGAQTRWRSLLRADDPAQLTPAGLQALAGYGLACVIDLRWPEEVAASPNPVASSLRQVRFHHLSLLERDAQRWQALSGECAKEDWKCRVLELAQPQLLQVLRTIAAAPQGPVLFHCVAGKDRTGIVAALLLALADVLPEAIAYDYAISSENLREYYLRRYANQDRAEILEALRCPPEGAHRMLALLAAQGGIRSYLQRIGLTAAEILNLRSRLRD